MSGQGGDVLYRMPAEWELHEATWLTWPHKRESWPGIFDRIPGAFAAVVRALREAEIVRLLSQGPEMDLEISHHLDGDLSGIEIHRVPTNDSWIRDYGPIFVHPVDPAAALALSSWEYNAWGGKYPPWDLDASVGDRLAGILGLPLVKGGMVLEGGSIDVDGEGTLLTTEACLLNPNRNPRLSREEIEARLRRFLGAEKVLWLGDGIDGDDTDGHVDDLARFVAPGRVVTVVEDDPSDPNHGVLEENLRRLESLRDARGRRLEVVSLPMPEPVVQDGQRCPASYANFLIANTSVIVPTFRCAADARALGILSESFPGRRIVGVDCRDLVWGLGAVHCMSQQQPCRATPGLGKGPALRR